MTDAEKHEHIRAQLEDATRDVKFKGGGDELAGAAIISIAISLRRIADAMGTLEALNQSIKEHG